MQKFLANSKLFSAIFMVMKTVTPFPYPSFLRWTFSFLLMILTAVWLLHCHVNHAAAVPRMQQHEGENLSDIIETIWSNICGPISMKDICRVAQPSLMISNGNASLTHFSKKKKINFWPREVFATCQTLVLISVKVSKKEDHFGHSPNSIQESMDVFSSTSSRESHENYRRSFSFEQTDR